MEWVSQRGLSACHMPSTPWDKSTEPSPYTACVLVPGKKVTPLTQGWFSTKMQGSKVSGRWTRVIVMDWSLVRQNISTTNPVILREGMLGSEVSVPTRRHTLIVLPCLMKNQWGFYSSEPCFAHSKLSNNLALILLDLVALKSNVNCDSDTDY